MEFLVRVSSPGDVPAFSQVLRDASSVSASQRDDDWIESVKSENEPVDATYVVVEASDQKSIWAAVDEVSRFTTWKHERPDFDVLDSRATREWPSYPARDFTTSAGDAADPE